MTPAERIAELERELAKERAALELVTRSLDGGRNELFKLLKLDANECDKTWGTLLLNAGIQLEERTNLQRQLAQAQAEGKLGNELCAVLSNYCGEAGVSEGAIETLNRKLDELARLKKELMLIREAVDDKGLTDFQVRLIAGGVDRVTENDIIWAQDWLKSRGPARRYDNG